MLDERVLCYGDTNFVLVLRLELKEMCCSAFGIYKKS